MVKNVGVYLKEKRTSEKMTQEGVATYLGINKSTYSRIENNLVELDLSKAIKLSKLFNFDISDIFEIEDEVFFNGNWVEYVIPFLLKELDLDTQKAMSEIKDYLNEYIENNVRNNMSIIEVYRYVMDNSDDRNFKWLMEDDDSLDDFMYKVAIDMIIDKTSSEILNISKKYSLEAVAETICECYDCSKRMFSCIENAEVVDDRVFCENCYDALSECKECGCKYYESNKSGYCIECR